MPCAILIMQMKTVKSYFFLGSELPKHLEAREEEEGMQSPVEMRWHTVTHGRGSEGETGKWSGQPVPYTLPWNVVYRALLQLMRTPRLPVID